jgi:uncharacterized protein (DUF58 family)
MAAPAAPSRRSEVLRVQQNAEALAARLPPLLVAALRVAATVAPGVHGRRRVGQGETFWQFRRYQPGDSAASIDWRQSAKSQPVYVRENEWEASQSVWLWCDRSPSMSYRSGMRLPTKRERGDLLALALAALLVRGGERVGLLNSEARPVHGHAGLARLATVLTTPSAFAPGLPQPEPVPRHARVVLIGDFLAPAEEVRQTISGLSGRGVRGHLLQVLDPAEETLPFEGRVEFAGLEGEREVLVPRVEVLREAYARRLAAHREELARVAGSAGWTFATHRTDKPPQTALLGLWHTLSLEGA